MSAHDEQQAKRRPKPPTRQTPTPRYTVTRKARGTFRPRLSLERTAYANGGWQWCYEIGTSSTGGGPTPRQATIAEALTEYFGILRRLGAKPA